MGSVLMQYLRAKYGYAAQENVDENVADFRKLQAGCSKWQIPQLTAVYAERLDERRAHSDSIETLTARWKTFGLNVTSVQPCLRDSLCHDRDDLVHHTSGIVSALCLEYLVSGSPTLPIERHVHGKLHQRGRCVEKYVALTSCQSCHSRLVPLSGVSEDCASTFEKYGSLSTGDRKRVASIASPALTLKPHDLHFRQYFCLVWPP